MAGDVVGIFFLFGLLPILVVVALFKFGMGYCKFHFSENQFTFHNPFIHSIRFCVTPDEIEKIHTIEHYRNGMFVGYKIKMKIKTKRFKKLVIWLPRKSTEIDLRNFLNAFEGLLIK